jgi:ribosomal protein S27AE
VGVADVQTFQFSGREALEGLFEEWEIEPGPAAFERAARYLGKLARGRSYGRRYILSVWNGKYPAGKPLERALVIALAGIDGADPRAGMGSLVAWSDNPEIQGPMIDDEQRFCKECTTPFMPNHPRRLYCFRCRPKS